MAATPAIPDRRSRFGLQLAAGQVRYQVLLLLRSPIGTFTALVIPLMLLVALNVATPEGTVRVLHGTRYADFLTPAMAVFAVLNACYVNVITSTVLAREGGILKRLRGTPLPLWAYVLGRGVAAAVVALASVIVVVAVGSVFLHVHLDGGRVAALAGVTGLGIVSFTILGLAVSTLIPRPDSALPVAYGTLLPLAFISDVFFPATGEPGWLHQVAARFPLAPIAEAAERIFTTTGTGWPMSQSQLTVTLAWTAGSSLITGAAFRWQPGSAVSWHRTWGRRRGGRGRGGPRNVGGAQRPVGSVSNSGSPGRGP
ncbi:ABC transporter permease [Jatrophihabitans cynanchi]|jgi:ABC-2 type transport system permease protein|uniref:Transport permease protein n=1 Tax=Jatrophihabitans cynanchi TaxID=2944128 RepID=A0ABY7JY49_9ACTN|nr:ABC transporter permease [Jatrophihabitans sp. SB3-54]WAX55996.1 ABC transporter permease [Jatrophihabitans sp. SB3-54]